MVRDVTLFKLVGGDFILSFITEHQLKGFFTYASFLEFENFFGR